MIKKHGNKVKTVRKKLSIIHEVQTKYVLPRGITDDEMKFYIPGVGEVVVDPETVTVRA